MLHFTQNPIYGTDSQLDGLPEGPDRMHRALTIHPLAIAGVHVERLGGDGRHHPAIPIARRGFEKLDPHRIRKDVEEALAVLRGERIQVDHRANAIRESVRDTRDHAAAIGVAA
jgi:hypothetical protein